MPPAVIAGAATLGGALIGSHAQGQANKSQQQASNAALQLERERDAEAKRRYDQKYANYQTQLTQWDANRRALAAHLGITLPGPAAAAPAPGAAPGGAPAGPQPGLTLGNIIGAPAGGRGGMRPEAGQLGPITGPTQGLPPAPAPGAPSGAPPAQGMTIGDISGWNDWGKYAAPR